MYNFDTKEEVDINWFLNALEDGEIFLDNRERTEEEKEEFSRAIAEYRATHPKTPIPQEAVLA